MNTKNAEYLKLTFLKYSKKICQSNLSICQSFR